MKKLLEVGCVCLGLSRVNEIEPSVLVGDKCDKRGETSCLLSCVYLVFVTLIIVQSE